MALDSKAVFADRVRVLGLGAYQAKFEEKGWDTIANFAFASLYVPGVSAAQLLMDEVVTPMLGEDMSREVAAKVSPLRRLFFECFTLSAADLKYRLERGDDEAPRKIPTVERDERKKALKQRLVGIKLDRDMEPSNYIIDVCVQMVVDNEVSYPRWEMVTRKVDELGGVKRHKEWKPDPSGMVRETNKAVAPTFQIGAGDRDLGLKLDYLLRRRGMAFEIGGVMTYETHEEVRTTLLEAYMEPPPPGYAPISLDMLRRVDEEVFYQLSQLCSGGIRPDANGTLPVDAMMQRALDSKRVRLLLQPLPGKSQGQDDSGQAAKRARTEQQQKAEQAKQAKLANQVTKVFDDGTKKPRGGKGKGERKGSSKASLPKELIGHCGKTPEGENLCYAFNLSSCDLAKPGEKCKLGWHMCARLGCQSKPEGDRRHAFKSCRS
jgi:hypothetical protein